MIKQYITDGKIVPMEVTIKLLENAMRDAMDQDKTANKFLIDGFPRQMDQAIKFDASVSTPLAQSSRRPGLRLTRLRLAGLPLVACPVPGLPRGYPPGAPARARQDLGT
jgi:hypothetical protein